MKKYILSPEAAQDISHIRTYLTDTADAVVARIVLSHLTDAFRRLSESPGIGHVRKDLSDEPVKFWAVYSYLIVYDPAYRPINIVRVIHGHRDVASLLQ